jgi:hypothetical protein
MFGIKCEGKTLLHRLKHRWEDDIKMELKEIACEGVDFIQVIQDRDQWWDLVDTALYLWVP